MRLLLRAGLASGGDRGPFARTCRSAGSCWAAIILCALGLSSATCRALEPLTPATPQLPATPSFCDQGCAIADLDGDGQPDLAIAKAEGWGPNGFQYRIDLDLSTRTGRSSFKVFAQRGGLRIIPCDVNGDWELDLVITSAWSFTPVGVWINDGHGGFIPTDPSGYPQSTWSEGPGVLSDPLRETFQAVIPQFSRNWADSSGGPCSYNALIITGRTLPLSAFEPRSGSRRRPQTRGPPLPFYRQPG